MEKTKTNLIVNDWEPGISLDDKTYYNSACASMLMCAYFWCKQAEEKASYETEYQYTITNENGERVTVINDNILLQIINSINNSCLKISATNIYKVLKQFNIKEKNIRDNLMSFCKILFNEKSNIIWKTPNPKKKIDYYTMIQNISNSKNLDLMRFELNNYYLELIKSNNEKTSL